MIVHCVICGAAFEKRRHGPSKYCGQKCRRVFELREHHRKTAERGLPKLGDMIKCCRCGIETTRRIRSGPLYCPPCAKIRLSEKSREWRERHPEQARQINQATDEKRRNDPRRVAWRIAYFRLRSARIRATSRGQLDHAMNVLIRLTARRGTGKAIMRFGGYAAADLHRHIARQFADGMSWENMAEWHIDHIVPKSAFTYSSPDDPDFKACWAMTNLRPLWKRDNIKKAAQRIHLL